MKRSFCCVVASFAFCSGLAPAVSQAAGLGGTWQGNVTQDNPNSTYPMEMELYGEKGSINYPSLRCGGTLQFVRSDGMVYWYREALTFGKDKCIDGGTVEMRPHPVDKSAWIWRWDGGGTTARGVLRGSGTPNPR
jgi:hypothetical protein